MGTWQSRTSDGDLHPDDGAANWAYNRAFLTFQPEGEASLTAQQTLKAAFKVNLYISKFILGDRRMPVELPCYIGFGGENEAVEYVETQTPGAIAWLRVHLRT